MSNNPVTPPHYKNQWLWFIMLYLGSVLTIFGAQFILHTLVAYLI